MNWQQKKDNGNRLFGEGRFAEAVNEYTNAIIAAPAEVVLFTNRALCYTKLGNYFMAETDCRKALELDNKNSKAYYLLGKCCLEAANYDEAIRAYTKALDYSKENAKTRQYHDEVFDGLYISKKRKWFQQYGEYAKKLENLRKTCGQLLRQNGDPDNVDDDLSMLEAVFMERNETISNYEIPDSFCCGISMEVMKDPVVTPSGNSYDRRIILRHLREIGTFDPVSRERMTESDLITNLALRGIIREFFDKRPWAYPEKS
jgi:STIP1 family protein 1